MVREITNEGGQGQKSSAYSAAGFTATDPISGSTQEMLASGEVPVDTENSHTHNELAGLGTSIPVVTPTAVYTPNYRRGGFAGNAEFGCTTYIDGVEVGSHPCTMSQLAGADSSFFDIYRVGHKDNTRPEPKPGKPDDIIRVYSDTTLTRTWIGTAFFFRSYGSDVAPSHGLSLPVTDLKGFGFGGQSSLVRSGGCLFGFGIAVSRSNPPTSTASSESAIDAAKAEIGRIMGEAGHRVTFDSIASADAWYQITLQGGVSGDSWASGFLGTGVGSLWTGYLNDQASKVGLAATGAKAIGIAMGRIIAHEAVIHNFLGRDNTQHTKDGLTQKAFNPRTLLTPRPSKEFRVPFARGVELHQLCEPRRIPLNYV